MQFYIYETHLHTKEASACGVTCGADYIEPYVAAGYSGIIVTDHFFNGNCAIDRNLDWETKVDLYCKGYENALLAAQKYNQTIGANKNTSFQVFFGFEYNFDCDEYLIYGLDKAWLKQHPEIMNLSHTELFDLVNKYNGLMVQAHPYRVRSYIKTIHLHPECVHAVETFNSANRPEENDKAAEYAKNHDLPATSGSDMHNINTLDSSTILGGVCFKTPLTSINDYVKRIKLSTNYEILNKKE